MTSVWMWWRGYVTVRLRGPNLERLLDNMAGLGIACQKVQRLTSGVIVVRLNVKDFRRLRPLLWGTQINVSILDKHGAPFLLSQFKLRVFLALGLLLSLFVMVYAANFIWFIEVTGHQTLPVETLQEAIGDLGLRAGVVRNSVRPSFIETELLKRFPVLAWAQVRVKGVRVEITLMERDGLDDGHVGPGHLFAAKDGVITEVLVLRGTSRVKEGTTVREGDLLISGEYYDSWGQRQFGAAQGVVKARVWYEGVGEGALVRWEPVPTGRRHKQYVITLGPISIPVGRSYPRETHLRSEKEWHLSLGRALVPLSVAQIDYQEVEYVQVPVSRERAEETAYALAWDSLARQGVQKDQVLKETRVVDFLADGEGLRVTVQVEALDDIGLFLTH
jgi:similar to stage IV sporulation protein